MFMFLFLFFSMLLLCPFFRLKELFQVKNGVTTSLLFFPENAKNLGRSDDVTQRKKEDGLKKEGKIKLLLSGNGHLKNMMKENTV